MELTAISATLVDVKTEVQNLRHEIAQLHTNHAVMDAVISGERGLGKSVDKLATVIDELKTTVTKLETKDATRSSIFGAIAGMIAAFAAQLFFKIFHF